MKQLLFLVSALLFTGCAQETTERARLVVAAGIPPVSHVAARLAEGVGGVQVATLVGAGQSPHSFEPTAKQIAQLSDADVLLTLGMPFENALVEKLGTVSPNTAVVAADAGITRRAMPHEHHGDACDHDLGATDPHVWLSLKNLRIIADNILAALIQADPENAESYRQNHDAFTRALAERDRKMTERLAPYAGTRFYVYHPSFGYFADDHKLAQFPIELDGKAPSPRQLAELIEHAQMDGVRIIFVQKRFPTESARAIADAIQGEVVQIDPLAEDVVATLELIADSIAKTRQP